MHFAFFSPFFLLSFVILNQTMHLVDNTHLLLQFTQSNAFGTDFCTILRRTKTKKNNTVIMLHLRIMLFINKIERQTYLISFKPAHDVIVQCHVIVRTESTISH